jgi:hypothetical protein
MSEISGFADILFICGGLFFTYFYVPVLKKALLVEKLMTVDAETKLKRRFKLSKEYIQRRGVSHV